MSASTALAAARPTIADPARVYVEARAAVMQGDHGRAARLFSTLAEGDRQDKSIGRRAVSTAIGAGDMALALKLAREMPVAELPIEARLLMVADEVRRDRLDVAKRYLSNGDGQEANLLFLEPLLDAWAAADRNDLGKALETIDQINSKGVMGAFKEENRAFILLKFRRAAEAEPFARRAIGSSEEREPRLRLALADAFLAAGDKARAVAMIEGMGTEAVGAKQRIAAGRTSGQAITGAEGAFSEVLVGLALDLNRARNPDLSVSVAQVARYADPRNSAATILLAMLMDANDRDDDALKVLASVPPSDPLIAQARDTSARILVDNKRENEALALAQQAVSAPGATASDFARFAEVLAETKRYDQAADYYGRAIVMVQAQGLTTEQWPLRLLRATALEDSNRWPEAKKELEAALAIAPEQPLILNFLGYAKLERGEDLNAAEAMIRKASSLAPDNASITDSLGWALYKRGRYADAITTLEQAAANDPEQAEIHEHLGDALFKVGRKFEARFAWSAALINAEDEIATRVRAKIESGLTPATAAP